MINFIPGRVPPESILSLLIYASITLIGSHPLG